MKRLLFLSLFLSSVSFANNKFSLGMSAGVNNSVYKTKKQQDNFFIPNLDIQYKGLFIERDEIGYTFWGDETLSLSITNEIFSGYPIKGKDLEKGYQDIKTRKSQIMTGISMDYNFLTNNYLSISTVFGKHGNKINLSFLKTIYLSDDLIFIPSVYGNVYSKDFSNYYFGVTAEEAEKNSSIKEAFSIEETFGVGVFAGIEKKINKSISVYTFASYETLSDKIKDSPIIKRNYFWTVGGGLKYTF